MAALGFALAWAQMLCPDGLMVWAAPEICCAEEGAPNAEGLAQFGLSLERLLIVRARTQGEALWAAEQALKVPRALTLATIAPAGKGVSLTATRRLLLAAEKHQTRAVLLRLDAAGASAAWMRWRIGAAPSRGADRELGAPAFVADLIRNRAGPASLRFLLDWSAHEHAFADRAMDGAASAAAPDRPAAPRRQSA
jgi:protein ImuA